MAELDDQCPERFPLHNKFLIKSIYTKQKTITYYKVLKIKHGLKLSQFIVFVAWVEIFHHRAHLNSACGCCHQHLEVDVAHRMEFGSDHMVS